MHRIHPHHAYNFEVKPGGVVKNILLHYNYQPYMAWVTAAAPFLVVVPIYAGFCTIPVPLSAKRGTRPPGFTPLFPVRRGIFQKSIF